MAHGHRETRVSLDEAHQRVTAARAGARRRSKMVAIVLGLATITAFAVSLAVGDFPMRLSEVIPALSGQGRPDVVLVVQEFRLPRALVGMVVGFSFGVSGAIFQSVARNPLASPDILGIMFGAGMAAVFVITTIPGGTALVPLAAVIGGMTTGAIIYLLAFRKGLSSYRLVLVGIGIGFMANAGTQLLLTRSNLDDAANATAWLAGGLNARGWETVVPLVAAFVVLMPILAIMIRPLFVLQLGDYTSRGLGVRVESSRLGLLFVAVALASVGAGAAGPVAFVAFVAPPIARRLTRTSLTVIGSGFAGALLVLVSDLAGRTLFPTEIPVGIITGIVGAPYLLWLLARANRIGSGG